jgi:tetratricopeptide (TPR) repeat protein
MPVRLGCRPAAAGRAALPHASKYRDGRKAVEQAKKALKLEKNPNGDFYATLAAAYAELMDFDEAVRWQGEALTHPDLRNDEDARRRLELYRNKKPYRQK